MRTIWPFYALSFLFATTLSCKHDDPTAYSTILVGTWRLYEEGRSPGEGYFTTPVSAIPLQQLTFTSGGTVTGQGDRLRAYYTFPFFRVDSTQTGRKLTFLTGKSAPSGYSVAYTLSNDSLRIMPMCYEGCHYGFVRFR